MPTKIDTKGGVEITQYEGHSVADMGLLKMDFLGLRTLTVISKALANIKANHGIDINVDEIPFDDPEIYKLMREGRTAGVFQIESAGMTSTIRTCDRPSTTRSSLLSPSTVRARWAPAWSRATSTA